MPVPLWCFCVCAFLFPAAIQISLPLPLLMIVCQRLPMAFESVSLLFLDEFACSSLPFAFVVCKWNRYTKSKTLTHEYAVLNHYFSGIFTRFFENSIKASWFKWLTMLLWRLVAYCFKNHWCISVRRPFKNLSGSARPIYCTISWY